MKKYYLGLVGFVIAVAMVECKKDDVLVSEPEKQSTTNTSEIIEEGSVVYSELLKDNQLIELSVDSLVNLGSEENPAYFYVNLSHTVYDKPVENKQTENSTAFFSVTLEDMETFISMYAEAQSLGSGQNMTDEEKQSAYHHLYNFLQENDIDGTQFVSTSLKNTSVLESALENGSLQIYDTSITDSILKNVVLRKEGLQLPYIIHSENEIVRSSHVVIDPFNDNTYVSYINKSENIYNQYYETSTFKSSSYIFRYGTKGCPMIECEFYIEGWYTSKLKTDTQKVLYVPYLMTIINNSYIGFSMYLEGMVTYYNPDIRQTDTGEYPIIGSGEVKIEYGDSWKVNRVAKLKFSVDGKTGFIENNWDSNE